MTPYQTSVELVNYGNIAHLCTCWRHWRKFDQHQKPLSAPHPISSGSVAGLEVWRVSRGSQLAPRSLSALVEQQITPSWFWGNGAGWKQGWRWWWSGEGRFEETFGDSGKLIFYNFKNTQVDEFIIMFLISLLILNFFILLR